MSGITLSGDGAEAWVGFGRRELQRMRLEGRRSGRNFIKRVMQVTGDVTVTVEYRLSAGVDCSYIDITVKSDAGYIVLTATSPARRKPFSVSAKGTPSVLPPAALNLTATHPWYTWTQTRTRAALNAGWFHARPNSQLVLPYAANGFFYDVASDNTLHYEIGGVEKASYTLAPTESVGTMWATPDGALIEASLSDPNNRFSGTLHGFTPDGGASSGDIATLLTTAGFLSTGLSTWLNAAKTSTTYTMPTGEEMRSAVSALWSGDRFTFGYSYVTGIISTPFTVSGTNYIKHTLTVATRLGVVQLNADATITVQDDQTKITTFEIITFDVGGHVTHGDAMDGSESNIAFTAGSPWSLSVRVQTSYVPINQNTTNTLDGPALFDIDGVIAGSTISPDPTGGGMQIGGTWDVTLAVKLNGVVLATIPYGLSTGTINARLRQQMRSNSKFTGLAVAANGSVIQWWRASALVASLLLNAGDLSTAYTFAVLSDGDTYIRYLTSGGGGFTVVRAGVTIATSVDKLVDGSVHVDVATLAFYGQINGAPNIQYKYVVATDANGVTTLTRTKTVDVNTILIDPDTWTPNPAPPNNMYLPYGTTKTIPAGA